MKAVIMAGGFATRLWPITKDKAKPLLPVGNKKIIDIIYEKISKFNFEIIISTNKRFKDEFKKWARNKKVKIVYDNSTKEEEKPGAIKALASVVKNFDEDFLVIAGDNIFSFELDPLINLYKNKRKPVIGIYDVKDYGIAKRYGVVELEGNKVKKVHEKPKNPISTLISTGIYSFPHEISELLLKYVEESNFCDNLGDFISYLCKNFEVYAHLFNGNWYDVGSPDSYIQAFKFCMENYIDKSAQIEKQAKIIEPVVIEKNVLIKGRCMIGPYVYIGENSEIVASDISESVIFSNTIVKNTKLWKSIIDDKCEIRNITLNNSIIGSHTKIQEVRE